jgi:hypothetical protein
VENDGIEDFSGLASDAASRGRKANERFNDGQKM